MSVKQQKTMNSSYFSTPPVVKNLIIINCLAFLGVWLIPSLNQFMGQYGVLYWFGSPYYHSYQFVTYMFLHASLEHLFFNMFALWMFGRTLEYALGSKRFLIYYMVCGVGAALVQMGVAGGAGRRNGIAVGFRCAVAQFDHHAAYPAHPAQSQVVRYYLCGDRTVVGMDRT